MILQLMENLRSFAERGGKEQIFIKGIEDCFSLLGNVEFVCIVIAQLC